LHEAMRLKLTDKRIERHSPKKTVEIWDTEQRGFGVRINRGGRRTFMIQRKVNGRFKRMTLGTFPNMTVDEARGEAKRILQTTPAGLRTFEQVCEQFVVDYVRARALRSGRDMERRIERYLIPKWGDRLIVSITRREVRGFLRDMARDKPIAANRLLALMRKIFNWAVDEEIIVSSPIMRMTPPAKERERERVLADDEIGVLWPQFQRLGYPFGSLFQMLLITGQRRSEVARMRWSEIEGEVWSIPNERSKGGHGHAVPLSPLATSILSAMPRKDEHVFSTQSGKPVSGFGRPKKRITGVDDWRLHDLRRTMATNLRRLGVDRLTVSKILNHREAGVTRIYDRYACDDEQREAMRLWSEKLHRGFHREGSVVVLYSDERKEEPMLKKPKYGIEKLADAMSDSPKSVRRKLRKRKIAKGGRFYDFKSEKGIEEVKTKLSA
jgi:integrase